MEKIAFKLCYESSEETARYPVIVVAAGSSSRMQGVNKQLALLEGVPVIVRTLKAFDNCPFISRIILVTRSEDIPVMQSLAEQYGISSLTDITEGGENRHESVKNGFLRLAENEERVLIHDGARPLITDLVIGNVTAALANEKAVICAVPIHDTVKRADENGYVKDTLDRTSLFAVQTPQGVAVKEYLEACQSVESASLLTDDAALMEAAGYRVRIVNGDRKNIKITTKGDLETARVYLEDGEEL